MNKPSFVAFTGIDKATDLNKCKILDREYPIEWGILFSSSNKDFRYSGMPLAEEAVDTLENVSVHLCGAYARETMLTGLPPKFVPERTKRIQLNLKDTEYDYDNLSKLSSWFGVIRQTRNTEKWPINPPGVYSLLDLSGGRGREIENWPKEKVNDLVGYAGGLNPKNISKFLRKLSVEDQSFWVDMETGIRTDNMLDLEKCRDVCEQIWS